MLATLLLGTRGMLVPRCTALVVPQSPCTYGPQMRMADDILPVAPVSLTPEPAANLSPPEPAAKAEPAEGILVATITAIVVAFQMTGPLCLSLTLVALGLLGGDALGFPGGDALGLLGVDAARATLWTAQAEQQLGALRVAPAEQQVAATWIATEAAFYLLQQTIALQPADGHSPFTGAAMWTPRRRRELWRRLLATQPPAEFVSSWLYREPAFPTPAELLLGWAGVPGFLSPAAAVDAADASFRGVSWDEMTEGDAYEWGARALFAASSRAALTSAQDEELQSLIAELEQAAGRSLAPGEPTQGVRSMCAQMDALRWASRPLLYYALSDGLVRAAFAAPKMRSLGYEQRRTEELSYHYRRRRGSSSGANDGAAETREEAAPAADAFVFVHGIGIGPAIYADLIERFVDDETPVVCVNIDAISQRLLPRATLGPDRFAKLLDAALAELGIARAVICGHSYGSALVSYALNRDDATATPGRRRRLCGAVLLDPIATLLHHSTTTREFVYRPISGLADAVADYLFKKELWTSLAVARSLVFHEASFFLEDCSARRPTLVAVGADDVVVAPDAIAERFGTWQARLAGVRVLRMEGIGHGGWIEDDPTQGDRLVAAVRSLRSEVANLGRLEELVPRLGGQGFRGVVVPTRLAGDARVRRTARGSERSGAARR